MSYVQTATLSIPCLKIKLFGPKQRVTNGKRSVDPDFFSFKRYFEQIWIDSNNSQMYKEKQQLQVSGIK